MHPDLFNNIMAAVDNIVQKVNGGRITRRSSSQSTFPGIYKFTKIAEPRQQARKAARLLAAGLVVSYFPI